MGVLIPFPVRTASPQVTSLGPELNGLYQRLREIHNGFSDFIIALEQVRRTSMEATAFCGQCQQAMLLDDIDEMIRRRDLLAKDLRGSGGRGHVGRR